MKQKSILFNLDSSKLDCIIVDHVGQKPFLEFYQTLRIQIDTADTYNELYTAFKEIISLLVERKQVSDFAEISLITSHPWSLSEIHKSNFNPQKKRFGFTYNNQKTIQQEQIRSIANYAQITNDDFVDSKKGTTSLETLLLTINGYPVTRIQDKIYGEELSVTSLLTITDSTLLEVISDVLNEYSIRSAKLSFYSREFVFYKGLESLFTMPKDYSLLTVNELETHLCVVRDGVLTELSHVQQGYQHLVEYLSVKHTTTEKNIVSVLAKLSSGTTLGFENYLESLHQYYNEIYEPLFRSLENSMSDHAILPPRIFTITQKFLGYAYKELTSKSLNTPSAKIASRVISISDLSLQVDMSNQSYNYVPDEILLFALFKHAHIFNR